MSSLRIAGRLEGASICLLGFIRIMERQPISGSWIDLHSPLLRVPVLLRRPRESFVAAIGRSVLDDDAFTINVPTFPQPPVGAIEVGGMHCHCRPLEHADAP
jgi:hypothetical protein